MHSLVMEEFSEWNTVSENHCLDKELLASLDPRSELIDRPPQLQITNLGALRGPVIID